MRTGAEREQQSGSGRVVVRTIAGRVELLAEGEEEKPSEIAAKIVVAIMDDDTCMVCAAWHGVEFDADDDVVVLPNRHCTNPGGCRCSWIPVPAGSDPE